MKVEKSEKFPEGLKYRFNFMVFHGNEWLNLVRIDNALHLNKVGKMHIHRIDKGDVQYIEVPLDKVKGFIVKIGKEVKERWLK